MIALAVVAACYVFVIYILFGYPLLAPWPNVAVGLPILCYGLAIADRWIGAAFPLKRLTSPIRTFVILMGAGVWALSFFFVPGASLWKQTR